MARVLCFVFCVWSKRGAPILTHTHTLPSPTVRSVSAHTLALGLSPDSAPDVRRRQFHNGDYDDNDDDGDVDDHHKFDRVPMSTRAWDARHRRHLAQKCIQGPGWLMDDRMGAARDYASVRRWPTVGRQPAVRHNPEVEVR